MVRDIDLMHGPVVPISGDVSVQGIGGHEMSVVATGCLILQDPEGRQLVLTDVFLVPELTANVVSVRMLDQVGLETRFSGGCVSVHNVYDGVRLFQTTLNGIFAQALVKPQLYNVDASLDYGSTSIACTHPVGSAYVVTFDLLHQRLGHPSTSVLHALVKHNCAIGLDVDTSTPPPTPCITCLKAKQPQVPHRPNPASASNVLELIHADLMGPLPVSLGGARYILAVLDDASRFSHVECIESKSDASDALLATIRLWERKTGKSVVKVRTDRGKEFCNKTLDGFLRSQGIQHQLTVRYSPQQNGRVERLN
jgi:hypothetical protein